MRSITPRSESVRLATFLTSLLHTAHIKPLSGPDLWLVACDSRAYKVAKKARPLLPAPGIVLGYEALRPASVLGNLCCYIFPYAVARDVAQSFSESTTPDAGDLLWTLKLFLKLNEKSLSGDAERLAKLDKNLATMATAQQEQLPENDSLPKYLLELDAIIARHCPTFSERIRALIDSLCSKPRYQASIDEARALMFALTIHRLRHIYRKYDIQLSPHLNWATHIFVDRNWPSHRYSPDAAVGYAEGCSTPPNQRLAHTMEEHRQLQPSAVTSKVLNNWTAHFKNRRRPVGMTAAELEHLTDTIARPTARQFYAALLGVGGGSPSVDGELSKQRDRDKRLASDIDSQLVMPEDNYEHNPELRGELLELRRVGGMLRDCAEILQEQRAELEDELRSLQPSQGGGSRSGSASASASSSRTRFSNA